MRALIVSDVHSNLNALHAVIEDSQRGNGFDIIWCLGDTVGYGPDPGTCLSLLRQYQLLLVAGNHDYAAVGKMGVAAFNKAAATAARWTAQQLSPQDASFLADAPLIALSAPFTLVHGSLRAPLLEYLLDQEAALATLNLLQTQFCLVGHSHIPFICMENGGRPKFMEFAEDVEFELGEERRIINPGSVGQPRDRDPRPSYAIYDSEQMTIERHRVTYDIQATQEKMRKAKLPQPLIDRLDYGV